MKIERSIWPDNATYFLTDSTYLHYTYFRSDEQKEIVLQKMLKLKTDLGIPLLSYSIACNHFHLTVYIESGAMLGKVWQLLRGGISYEYRKRFRSEYEKMWQTKKTIAIRNQRMKYLVTGYVIGNLLKHREVSTVFDLEKNRYSSFWHIVRQFGMDEAQAMVYRVIEVDEDAWGGVDVGKFEGI